MAKRIADKELTDRNWDQEDEGEEAGTFSIASEDVLKNRAIKKAKRRNVGGENETSGAFKGFKGFCLNSSTASGGTTSSFSGFGNGALPVLTNGNNTTACFGGFSASTVSAESGSTYNGSSSTKPTSDITTNQTNGSTLSLTQSSSSCSSSIGSKEYSRQLTTLNCSVRDWITKHVNDNPLCDLNPIFRDYERHLASIEKKYGGAASESAAPVDEGSNSKMPGERQKGQLPASTTAVPFSSGSITTGAAAAPTPASALFPFGKEKGGSPQDKSSMAPAATGITFNFGQKVDSSALGYLGAGASPSNFSFSAKPSSSQGSVFGASSSTTPPAPFFSGTKAEATQPADENGEDESEEPPKPEVREIKEKDAFYSKKCKLFYKKESEFKEKGMGTLHLKQTPEGKTQMIVRADTNLGNILLNIIVPASMPCSRMGKNNVMVVCVTNPPVDEKNPNTPTPLLIRVKTAEDADELHKILEEKKV